MMPLGLMTFLVYLHTYRSALAVWPGQTARGIGDSQRAQWKPRGFLRGKKRKQRFICPLRCRRETSPILNHQQPCGYFWKQWAQPRGRRCEGEHTSLCFKHNLRWKALHFVGNPPHSPPKNERIPIEFATNEHLMFALMPNTFNKFLTRSAGAVPNC